MDRGRLLLSTEQEQRRRLGRFVSILSLLLWGPLWLTALVLWTLETSDIWDPFILILGLVGWAMTLMVLAALYMAHGFVPGVYLRGVQLAGRVFVPFEEVDRTSIKKRIWERELTLHMRMSKDKYGLEEMMYGKEGFDYIEARVRGQIDEGGDPPRLVVYPTGGRE